MGQANLMASDLEMYNEELDTPCAVRSSNLGQELGKFNMLCFLGFFMYGAYCLCYCFHYLCYTSKYCISYFRSGQQHFLRQDR